MKIYLAHPDAQPDTDMYQWTEALRVAIAAKGNIAMPQGDELETTNLTERRWVGENSADRITHDIQACDLMIAFTAWASWPQERIMFSMGYALALDKPVIQIGPVLTTLQCLPQITHYYTIGEVLDALEKLT